MSDLIDIKRRTPVERLTIANTLIQSVAEDISAQPDIARDIATILENEQDMRVIARNAQQEITEEQVKEYCRKRELAIITNEFLYHLTSRNEPSIYPERKKGKWLYTDAAPHRVYCSVCYKSYIPNKEWVAWKENIVPKKFCPNCGAEMKGEEDG